jgi:hypothetical protein
MINRDLLSKIENTVKPLRPSALQAEMFKLCSRNVIEQFNINSPHNRSLLNEFKNISESMNFRESVFERLIQSTQLYSPQNIAIFNVLASAMKNIQDSQTSIYKVFESLRASHQNTLDFNFKLIQQSMNSISLSSVMSILVSNSQQQVDDFVNFNKNIALFTNQIAEEPERITQEDFNNFKYEMKVIYEKSNSNSKVFSIYWGFIFLLLGIIYDITQKNKEFTSEQKEFLASGLSEIKQELTNEIRKDKAKDSIERTARTNVNLRSKNSTKSKIVGLVKKDQKVFVLDRIHKWIIIAYIDSETNEPKTGFAFKKYFE